MMESISSKVRFSLLPYSAAQQPVQWRLQALVGSRRMAQGMLQLYSARNFSWMGQPMMLALRKKFWKVAFSTSLSTSRKIFMMSRYMLLEGSLMTARKASRWGSKLSGPLPASLSTHSISLGRFFSGSFSM
jgi:hypothetical protein